ncbi:MAG: hypothetical protein R3A43_05025 [Bacteroidia bacterium]
MSTYIEESSTLVWETAPIYGSTPPPNPEEPEITTIIRGQKVYEISNLPIDIGMGNVLATITYRKIGANGSSSGNWAYFEVDYQSFTDYYPPDSYRDGMTMEERSWSVSAEGYRYSFNGKEKDDEVSGSGNTIAFEMRIFDCRLGRFFSVDPLSTTYPTEGTYNFAHNVPILLIDFLGMGDPPKNFTKHLAPNGSDLYIPSSAQTVVLSDKDKGRTVIGTEVEAKFITGSLESFTIGTQKFEAHYSTKTGEFTNYKNTETGEEYKTPTIAYDGGGFYNNRMQVSFKIEDVGAQASVQAIQIVVTNIPESSAKYKKGNSCGFVDGGKNSPGYAQNGGKEVVKNKPYYIGTFRDSKTGTITRPHSRLACITMQDYRQAQLIPGSYVQFQVIIVATNFYGSGQNVVIGTVNWGFIKNIPQHVTQPPFTIPSQTSLDILKVDYPVMSSNNKKKILYTVFILVSVLPSCSFSQNENKKDNMQFEMNILEELADADTICRTYAVAAIKLLNKDYKNGADTSTTKIRDVVLLRLYNTVIMRSCNFPQEHIILGLFKNECQRIIEAYNFKPSIGMSLYCETLDMYIGGIPGLPNSDYVVEDC